MAARIIATESLARNRPGEFFDVVYPIPEKFTQEKEYVTVRFRPRPGQVAGGVFACCAVRRDP